jgi:MFS family permease
MSSQSHLLATRRFLPLFVTQFLGAFNDNTFKNALVVLLTFQAMQWTTLSPGVLANLAAGLFILPFFLFSATAGQLADKYDKARLARLVKLLEMVIMLIAGLGFWQHSLVWLMSALFLLGLHSTLFGPIKYALLPQHLQPPEILGGNALIEAGTFIAILLGTLAGGLLAGMGAPLVIAAVGLTIAAVGYLSSRFIPTAPAPMPDLTIHLNPLVETWRTLGLARENRTVFLSILGISWFWFFGALFLAQFPAYAKDVLGGSETTVTLLLATFTIGVGLGSLACERLSGHRVELGLVPFGSIGLTVFAFDLFLASPSGLSNHPELHLMALLAEPGIWRILIDLLLIGLFGGFFIVPLYALVQMRSREDCRARVIAANNIVNALFMVVGAVLAAALLLTGWTIPALFGAAALFNALVALFIYSLVPEFLVRFVVWLLMHRFGHDDNRGFEQIPEEGAALIQIESDQPLHRLDVLMIMAACRRPIRFMLDTRLARHTLFRWLMRETNSHFAGLQDDAPTSLLRVAREAIKDGQIVLSAHAFTKDDAFLADATTPVFNLSIQQTGRAGWRLFQPAVLTLESRMTGIGMQATLKG